jgi:sugar phosphate isomerase/epimerase
MFQLGINIDNEDQKPASEIAPGWDFTEIPIGEFLAPFNSNAWWAERRAHIESLPVAPIKATSHLLDKFGLIATGPGLDWEQVEFWIRRAFERVAELGIGVVGCYGGHFPVPGGLSKAKVMDQAIRFCNLLADNAKPHGIVIALEPYSGENLLFRRYLEGLAFAREVSRPEIYLMADLNYFIALNQDLEDIAQAPEMLVHAHIAGEHAQPGVGDLVDFHTHFFRVLRDIGYEGTVSAACPWKSTTGGDLDLRVETAKSLRYLQELRDKVYSE